MKLNRGGMSAAQKRHAEALNALRQALHVAGMTRDEYSEQVQSLPEHIQAMYIGWLNRGAPIEPADCRPRSIRAKEIIQMVALARSKSLTFDLSGEFFKGLAEGPQQDIRNAVMRGEMLPEDLLMHFVSRTSTTVLPRPEAPLRYDRRGERLWWKDS